MADIVTRILRLVQEHGSDKAEQLIRQQDGGCRHYVAARMQRDNAAAIGQLLQRGIPPMQAFRELGVSPRTGWRILKKPYQAPNRG